MLKKLNLIGHSEYIQMLINAKTAADLTNKPRKVYWRGYFYVVKPNLPPFTKSDFRKMISDALLKIKLPTEEERQVNLIVNFNCFSIF